MKNYTKNDAPASENKIASGNIRKRFLSLTLACPLDKDSANCEFMQLRDLPYKYLTGLFYCLSDKKIDKMLLNHHKCMSERGSNKKLKKLNGINSNSENESAYIVWNSDIPIEKLAEILENLNWINSKTEFIQFFNTPALNHKVRWNMDFIHELAYLFYKLKENNLIKTIHSKAYFSTIEQSFIDYFFNKIKKNTLKKNSSKINTKPIKYFDIITNIENIINKISNN